MSLKKEFLKQKWAGPIKLRSLVINLVSFIFGVLVTLFSIYFPVEIQVNANLLAVRAEILDNQDKMQNIIAPEVVAIVINPQNSNDIANNLGIANTMKKLSTTNFNQLTIAYYQLPSILQSKTLKYLLNEIYGLYHQYDLLNNNIETLNTIATATSLGAQGEGYLNFFKNIQTEAVVSNANAYAASTDISNDIVKYTESGWPSIFKGIISRN